MRAWLETTTEIAVAAGDMIRRAWDGHRNVTFKGEVDLVTDTDRAVEALVVERLQAAFPTHRILAEETALAADFAVIDGDDHVWIVDPLDGTTNFAHGYPHVAVSIGLVRGGDLLLGVVHDPMRDETFAAARDCGATLNGRQIRVSQTSTLDSALVGTGFPYDRRQHAKAYLRFVEDFMLRTQGIRRAGTAALDLCWVACGRLDAFWELKLKPWDVAGGAAIVLEAGGKVSDFDGGAFDPRAQRIVASNGLIHADMTAIAAARLASEPELASSLDWP